MKCTQRTVKLIAEINFLNKIKTWSSLTVSNTRKYFKEEVYGSIK